MAETYFRFLHDSHQARKKGEELAHRDEVITYLTNQMPFRIPFTFIIGFIQLIFYFTVLAISCCLWIWMSIETLSQLIRNAGSGNMAVNIMFSIVGLLIPPFTFFFGAALYAGIRYMVSMKSVDGVYKSVLKEGYIEKGEIIEVVNNNPTTIEYTFKSRHGKTITSSFTTHAAVTLIPGSRIKVLALDVYDKYTIGIPL